MRTGYVFIVRFTGTSGKKSEATSPVLVKLGAEDGFPEGLTFEEGKKAAYLLARCGYDALEVSSGLRGIGYERTERYPFIETSS